MLYRTITSEGKVYCMHIIRKIRSIPSWGNDGINQSTRDDIRGCTIGYCV